MRSWWAFLVLAAFSCALCACSEDPATARDEDDAQLVDAGEERDASASANTKLDARTGHVDASAPASWIDADLPELERSDASTTDAERSPFHQAPTNVSFATAILLEDGAITLQDELSADQIDYYKFRGEAGQFYELRTSRHRFSPDNVISLYDAEHNLIASNDDGAIWPDDGIDARLIIRLPQTGEYFVTVDDPFTPPEYFERPSFTLLYYSFVVRKLGEGAGFAREGTTAVALATDEATQYRYVTLLGEFNQTPDSFTLPGAAQQALIGHVHPTGTTGSGSTATRGRVRIDAVDAGTLGAIDLARGQSHIDPPIGEGDYQVQVSADGPPGANDFYVIDLYELPDNPSEQAEANNNTLAGAEPLTFTGLLRRRALLLSRLTARDVDYYRIEARANEPMSVACEAASGGSGVRELRAELRDAKDATLAFAVEDERETLVVPTVLAPSAGNYYVRLTSSLAGGSDAVEPWVRCVVLTGP